MFIPCLDRYLGDGEEDKMNKKVNITVKSKMQFRWQKNYIIEHAALSLTLASGLTYVYELLSGPRGVK